MSGAKRLTDLERMEIVRKAADGVLTSAAHDAVWGDATDRLVHDQRGG